MPQALRVLLAPDKFKGSTTAGGFCESVTEGLSAKLPGAEIRSVPLADGGDGTLEVLREVLGLRAVRVPTVDPLGRPIEATYLADDERAFVEVAAASGLVLLAAGERNPAFTSTYGTGVLVKHAIERGTRHVFLLLGGSATNDMGFGIAQALCVTFGGVEGHATGGQLPGIREVRLPAKPMWSGVRFTLFCDVDNPLYGSQGAAYVYAPQKGASAAQVVELDAGLRHATGIVEALYSRHPASAKTHLAGLPGGGAAGGIGAGMVALFGAELRPGFAAIAELMRLDEHIAWADVVVTGEGQLDEQSFRGKVVGEVLARCVAAGRPCHLVVGRVGPGGEGALVGAESVTALVELAPTAGAAVVEARRWLEVAGRGLGEALAGRGV